jgi:CxxC-x17-CxxC domain-containing protein
MHLEFHKVRTGKKSFGNKARNNREDSPSKSYRNSQDQRKNQLTTVMCADCGEECQIPFVPTTDRPVYCSECFRKNKPQENRDDRGSRYSRDDRKPERFTAECDNCGDVCDLPFKPKFDRPVYCSECFSKVKLGDEDYEEDIHNTHQQKPRESSKDKSKKIKSLKKMESFYSGGSEKFYNTIKEKLFEILGGKMCSSCGFKDEKALGFRNMVDDTFDSIKRSGFASSWGRYISDPSLAKEDLRILCLNCNAIQEPFSAPKQKAKNSKEKKKRFPR